MSANTYSAVVQAAADLCENIRENGSHDNWKQLAHALDALAEAQTTPRRPEFTPAPDPRNTSR